MTRNEMRYLWLRCNPAFETECFLSGLTPEQFDEAVDANIAKDAVVSAPLPELGCPQCGWRPLAWRDWETGGRPMRDLRCRECGWSQSGTA